MVLVLPLRKYLKSLSIVLVVLSPGSSDISLYYSFTLKNLVTLACIDTKYKMADLNGGKNVEGNKSSSTNRNHPENSKLSEKEKRLFDCVGEGA